MYRDTFFAMVYGVIATVILAANWLGYHELRSIFKPLIMISLIAGALFTLDKREISRKPVFILGMVFACLGDILLMLEGYFLQGLGAFLVMQVLYILTFYPEISVDKKTSVFWKASGCVVVLLCTLWIIFPHLEELPLRVAVPVYAFTITLMVFIASVRSKNVSARSYTWVLIGALLFMVSDTLIALNAFVNPVENSHFWIMSTYMMAQFLILKGLLKSE